MSRRKHAHRVGVRKYNRFPGTGEKKMWWADCACGWYQGEHDKNRARQLADEHLAKTGETNAPTQ